MIPIYYVPNINQTTSIANKRDDFYLYNRPTACQTIVQQPHDPLAIEYQSGCESIMWLAYKANDKSGQLHADNAEMLYRSLYNCLQKKGIKINTEIIKTSNVMNQAFVNFPIKKVVVDYGVESKAIVYDVLFNNGLRFVSRAHVNDEEGIVTFAIYNKRELLYMDSDLLVSYSQHVSEFWQKMNQKVEFTQTTYELSHRSTAKSELC